MRVASLTYDDKGLLAKVLPPLAESDGLKPDDAIKTALAGLAGFAAPRAISVAWFMLFAPCIFERFDSGQSRA